MNFFSSLSTSKLTLTSKNLHQGVHFLLFFQPLKNGLIFDLFILSSFISFLHTSKFLSHKCTTHKHKLLLRMNKNSCSYFHHQLWIYLTAITNSFSHTILFKRLFHPSNHKIFRLNGSSYSKINSLTLLFFDFSNVHLCCMLLLIL